MEPDQAENLKGRTLRISPTPWIYQDDRLLDLEGLNRWLITPKGPAIEGANLSTGQVIRIPLALVREFSEPETLLVNAQMVIRGNKVRWIRC